MSSTDRLRTMLDERGVEYETYIEPLTGFEHVKWNFNEHGSADFNLEFGEPWLVMYGAISGPEQAIEATLGRETCRNASNAADEGYFKCSACGASCSVEWESGGWDAPRHCPNCGAKVVEE